jgi:hypothetical protein
VLASLLLHGAALVAISTLTVLPPIEFELQLPAEVQFGITEATPPPAPPAAVAAATPPAEAFGTTPAGNSRRYTDPTFPTRPSH